MSESSTSAVAISVTRNQSITDVSGQNSNRISKSASFSEVYGSADEVSSNRNKSPDPIETQNIKLNTDSVDASYETGQANSLPQTTGNILPQSEANINLGMNYLFAQGDGQKGSLVAVQNQSESVVQVSGVTNHANENSENTSKMAINGQIQSPGSIPAVANTLLANSLGVSGVPVDQVNLNSLKDSKPIHNFDSMVSTKDINQIPVLAAKLSKTLATSASLPNPLENPPIITNVSKHELPKNDESPNSRNLKSPILAGLNLSRPVLSTSVQSSQNNIATDTVEGEIDFNVLNKPDRQTVYKEPGNLLTNPTMSSGDKSNSISFLHQTLKNNNELSMNVANNLVTTDLEKSGKLETDGLQLTLTPVISKPAPITNSILSNGVSTSVVPSNLSSNTWAQDFNQQIVLFTQKDIKHAQLQLNPQHLGPVEVRISIGSDQQVNIAFNAQHGVVKEAIDAALPRLREMFDQQGLNLADVTTSNNSRHPTKQQHQDNSQTVSNNNTDSNTVTDVSDSVLTSTLQHNGLIDFYA